MKTNRVQIYETDGLNEVTATFHFDRASSDVPAIQGPRRLAVEAQSKRLLHTLFRQVTEIISREHPAVQRVTIEFNQPEAR